MKTVCTSPWVIPVRIPVLHHTIDELREIGLSECYQSAGENAVRSHLWLQGAGRSLTSKSIPAGFIFSGENIILYFGVDADLKPFNISQPKLVSLSGTVIHDLNANARQDPDEPFIQGVRVCLDRNTLNSICTVSSTTGEFQLSNILTGTWDFRIENSEFIDHQTRFNYAIQMVESGAIIPKTQVNGHTIEARVLNRTKLIPIKDSLSIQVSNNTSHNFYLTQEWATYLSSADNAHLFKINAYQDYDLRLGKTRLYNGETSPTYDQHDGIDISCPRGTEILAAAEGAVLILEDGSTVAIVHPNQYVSIYGHGNPLVKQNEYVHRGYPVTLCDSNLTDSEPHVHFAVWRYTPWLDRILYAVPPFGDLTKTTERWNYNRYPLYQTHIFYQLEGGRGVWTEINQPHYPDVKIMEP